MILRPIKNVANPLPTWKPPQGMWEQEPVDVRISLLGPGLSSSTGHSESQLVVMLFKQAGTWWFVFCLIYYKITQGIFNRASESILGNPQKNGLSHLTQNSQATSD